METIKHNQDYSIPQSLYVERRSTNPALTTPVNRAQPANNPNTQNYSIPQSFYVEQRSTNPVPVTQPNQPQYIEPNSSSLVIKMLVLYKIKHQACIIIKILVHHHEM